jgi:hypothetical protein
LGAHLHGHLLLTVTDGALREPYPRMIGRSSQVLNSVVRGCYVTAYAQAPMTQNGDLIGRLLLDATFKIVPSAVASITNRSVWKVGVPLALAFGPVEDMDLSETFHRVVRQLSGIDLRGSRVVCDQGSALRVVCKQHENQQFVSLGHLLVSLKTKPFSDEIGNLVRCRVRDDYDLLCAAYAPVVAAAEQLEARQLSRTLAQAALAFESREIRQSDPPRRESVSMMTRVMHCLPSTFNALESAHSHANEETPRRNGFLASIQRVGATMIRKALSFRQALKHDFRATVFKARHRAALMDRDLMAVETA